VLSGLNILQEHVARNDWVLVHDAARPCISKALIDKLVKKVMRHPIGGILGLPVTETIKKTDPRGVIIGNVAKENIWRAQTPQMFRLHALHGALTDLKQRNVIVTDEASAMEFVGMRPLIVKGLEANLKITTPSDLPLAEYFLEAEAKVTSRVGKRGKIGLKEKKKVVEPNLENSSLKAGRVLMKMPKFLSR
jgi:2-C-methyl-D-erythritol 4-phosphate cytidylyltransferase